MKHTLLGLILLVLVPVTAFTQGVSCPAVVTWPDTAINCHDCVRLNAAPVSGFTTTDYTVQPIAYNPYPYNAGTPILVSIDDIWGNPLPIGFNFCFYGNTYSQCIVGSNGILSFDLAQAGGYCAWPIAQGIPGNTDVLNSILGPYHDIDPSVSGNIYWTQYGQAPCRVFVVSFYQIPMFGCNTEIATQQIVLYETTNIIEVYIQNRPSCPTWNDDAAIEGLQNATGTNAVIVPGRNFPTVWTASNDAYAFVPAGTPNYTLAWYKSGNPVPLTTLDTITVCPTADGEYYAEVIYTNCDGSTVTVRDTAGVTIIPTVFLAPVPTDVLCNGDSNGVATVTVTGNIFPCDYSWSNGQNTSAINNLSPGTYYVTVLEQNGCAVSTNVIIGEPSIISLVTVHTDALCNGGASGTANVTASGGVGGFNYLWSNGAITQTVSGLIAGIYTVTVTDGNSCEAIASVTIAEPSPVVASILASDIRCFGQDNGTAVVQVSGGSIPYNYFWSTGSSANNIFDLVAGNYGVTVTDLNGCTGMATTTIIEPPQIDLQISGDDGICVYDSVRLASALVGGVSPYHYQWMSTPTAVNDTNPNLVYVGGEGRTYFLTIVDQHGCAVTDSFHVDAYPRPIVDFYPYRREACDSSSILLLNTSVPNTVGALWEFSDGTTSTLYSPIHFFGVGFHDIRLTVTTNEGCTNTLLREEWIEVIPTPEASFVTDPNLTLLDHLMLSEAKIEFNNTSPYYATAVNWSFGNGDSAFVGQVSYTYPDTGYFCTTMTAYNKFGCHDDATQCIHILQDPFLWVPTGFTPNGDGLNDNFLVSGLEIVDFDISIFDRWGRLIFFSDKLDKGWDGKAMDHDAPEGAYAFRINAVNNIGVKIIRPGTVTLVR